MLKKLLVGLFAITAGILTVFGGIYFVEKRREETLGGKLMRVNYLFTKDFED
ncbi:MAG TPA: stress-responsive transcriptional regulator PspC [Acetobacterium sp.]